MDTQADSGTLETPKDAGEGQAGVVKRWLMALDLSGKQEKDWRASAKKVVERYRQEGEENNPFNKERTDQQFNILWSNTEVMRPALYHSTPKPDVRRRYNDEDPQGKEASIVLERAIAYQVDNYDFDQAMTLAVLDLLLPGRAVTRVRYLPTLKTITPPPQLPPPLGFNGDGTPIYAPEHLDENGQPKPQQQAPYDVLVDQDASCEHVAWADFRRGPGRTWDEVEWIAFQHRLTKDQLTDQFGAEIASKVTLDCEADDDDDDKKDGDDNSAELLKRAYVWEIWDKLERQVIFLAPSLKEQPLKTSPDALGLKAFFPIPRPMVALESSDTLVPVELFKLYKDQADELDRITRRINKLINGLKLRGIYDPTLGVLERLMTEGDNTLLPAADSSIATLQTAGAFDKAIWLMPIQTAAQVLRELYVQRDQIKQTIYEITGLSDILRGETDANETLGAQQIKAQSGSRRLRRFQKEVQRYARDLYRLKGEIISEHFEPQILSRMTGKQVTPELAQFLRSDLTRTYRVDIETDSTIAEDEQADQQAVSELLQGITGFVAAFGPVVQAGFMPATAAVTLLKSIVRRFRLGREVEDALDDAQAQLQAKAQQPPQPTPEQQAQQAEMEQQAQQHQLDMQTAAADEQRKQQAFVADETRKQQMFEREQARADQAAVADAERKRYETEARVRVMQQAAEAQAQATRTKAATAGKKAA